MPHSLPLLRWAALLLVWLLIGGCYPRDVDPPANNREGYVPVYQSLAAVQNVQVLTAQPLRQTGKIYIKDGFLFVVEPNKGIHVINNRDPEKPVAQAFISVPGVYDVAIKDSTLYANNTMDLVAFNVARPSRIELVKRVANAFALPQYPPFTNVYFECADPAKGVVVSWVRASLTNPNCYR
ncbi:MAG: hypothetical protein H7Z72_15715 [Bacteroidetes bacterium]|nr:hypothetical protein [Fibrella sp.]